MLLAKLLYVRTKLKYIWKAPCQTPTLSARIFPRSTVHFSRASLDIL